MTRPFRRRTRPVLGAGRHPDPSVQVVHDAIAFATAAIELEAVMPSGRRRSTASYPGSAQPAGDPRGRHHDGLPVGGHSPPPAGARLGPGSPSTSGPGRASTPGDGADPVTPQPVRV